MVYTRDFKRDPGINWTKADVSDLMRKTAVSVAEVLQATENPKEQIVRQKAVARTVVEAAERADGFRYSFHNNWLSREDKAHRFSFFCNDSTLNKGRAANGGVGSEGREMRKAAYDCKGLIAVKFSVTKNNLEVHYRHVPLHKTYEERAPPPRRESKRRRLLEILDPELVKKPHKKQKIVDGIPKEQRKRSQKATLSKPGRASSTSQSTIEGQEGQAHQVEDQGLQPLIDFLGSAERVTPMIDQIHAAQGDNDDGNDGGISIVDDTVGATEDGASATPGIASVVPVDNPKESSTRSKPRGRPKMWGPVLPGQMEGSLQSGNITWGLEAPSRTQKKQFGEEKSKTNKKDRKSDPSAGLTMASDEPISELEMLKQQLAATQERLQKLEAERRQPYPPYPPPHQYPHYPYPPPPPPSYYPSPQHYYPPPPNGYSSGPSTPTAQQQGPWHHHQLPSAAPLLYPGGPPHPNAQQRYYKPPMQYSMAQPQPQPQQIPQQPSARQELSPATNQALGTIDIRAQEHENAISSQARSSELLARIVLPSPDAVLQSEASTSDDQVVPEGEAVTATTGNNPFNKIGEPALSVHSQPQSSPHASPAPSNTETTMRQWLSASNSQPSGVSNENQTSATSENAPTVIVTTSAGTQNGSPTTVLEASVGKSQSAIGQPMTGVLKLTHASNAPITKQNPHASEDVRMKPFFDSAMAAISESSLTKPVSANAPPPSGRPLPVEVNSRVIATTTAGPPYPFSNAPSAWSGPWYSHEYGPNLQNGWSQPLPPYQYVAHPYPYPPSQSYPYPCPPAQPYPYPRYGPPPSDYRAPPLSSSQPTPATPSRKGSNPARLTNPPPPPPTQLPIALPPKPGERPPPGYDALREQMVAHANATPTSAFAGVAKDKPILIADDDVSAPDANIPTQQHPKQGVSSGRLAIGRQLRIDTWLHSDTGNIEGEEGTRPPQSAINVSSVSSNSSEASLEIVPRRVEYDEDEDEEDSDDSEDSELVTNVVLIIALAALIQRGL